MRFLLNKFTLISAGFISICLIAIGFILQTILFPIPDINLISRDELLVYQKEYALNYRLGILLLELGLSFMNLVIALLIMKLMRLKRIKSKSNG